MKTKLIVAFLAVLLAFAFTGAKESPQSLVTVGQRYNIASGSLRVLGKVTADLGGGWVTVLSENIGKREEMAVNLAQAFYIQPARD